MIGCELELGLADVEMTALYLPLLMSSKRLNDHSWNSSSKHPPKTDVSM